MKKRIFVDMAVVIFLTAFLFTALSGIFFHNQFGVQMKEGLKTLRVTIIDETGAVGFDNYRTDLENHNNRPEVIAAREHGVGESQRYSDTLGENTTYYAMKMPNDSILRLAFTTSSITGWLYGFLPYVVLSLALVLTISLLLAKRLAHQLLAPINAIDLDRIELAYDELAPFARKIETQQQEISTQIAALEDKAHTIAAITDNMKEGLLFVDKDGIILSFNKRIEEIFNEKDLSGKNILHLSRQMDFLDHAKFALSGTHTEMVYSHLAKTYAVYFSPATLENAVNGAIILFLDISDKLMAEKQRKEFSANVSHELKTPLTVISALSEMIAQNMAKPEDVQNFAEKIHAQSGGLLALIDDIIRLSEFDEGRLEKSFEAFDVAALARTVAENLTPLAASKNVAVFAPEGNLSINANQRMIEELLFNLIDNGIKYNQEGGRVTVSIEKSQSTVTIRVSDTGIGIDPKHHSRIFERFYRVDKSRSKQTGGTGLGLSIVKHIAEYHGGHVAMESEPGKGTVIACTFPG